jgi:hypothetical protein
MQAQDRYGIVCRWRRISLGEQQMDNQQLSSIADNTTSFPASSKQQAPKTVARLLVDKAAMEEWTSNIEKIRHKESGGMNESTA